MFMFRKPRHGLYLTMLLAILPVLHALASGVLLTADNAATFSSDNLTFGLPSRADAVIDRQGYALGYSERHEQAAWVAYRLTADEVRTKVVNRTDDFREDPLIPTGSAALADYRGSGFDRGHLAPAADMHWSRRTMSDSFFLSNMSPQRPAFNRGIWRKLEQTVRQWAVDNEEIHVVTGPVLTGHTGQVIGANAVTVPAAYYKVVFDARKPGIAMIGLIVPHRGSSAPLSSFAVSVDTVEEKTGLDFFPDLPDEIEDRLEASLDVSRWSWSGSYAVRSSVDSRTDPPAASGTGDNEYPYVASRRSKKFHRAGCGHAKRISPANLTGYATRGQAIRAGKTPCKACRP